MCRYSQERSSFADDSSKAATRSRSSVQHMSDIRRRRELIGFAAIVAVPLLFLADSLVVLSRGWEVQWRWEKLPMLIAFMAVFFSALVLLSQRGRRLYREHSARLLLLIVSGTVAFSFGEILLRATRPAGSRAPFHGREPGLRKVFHPDPDILPGVGPEAHFTINSLGIRGPELSSDPSVYKILCIGGSTTECLYLDDCKTWPHLLMLQLNQSEYLRPVWVGNMGYSGFSSRMHLRFAEGSDIMSQDQLPCVARWIQRFNEILVTGTNSC